MHDVETEIEPPGLDFDDDDGHDSTVVHVAVVELDGTRRAGYASVPGDASDDDLADCLVAALRGAAACRGPGLVAALNRRLGEQ